MFTATKDKALLTTTTGALPRPSWYTANLRGQPLSQGFSQLAYREQHFDCLACHVADQHRAGIDIYVDGDTRLDDDVAGRSWVSYATERLSGIGAPRVEVPAALQAIVRTDHLTRLEHSYGKAGFDATRMFMRSVPNPPDAVAFPETEADIEDGIEFARTSPDPDPADILDDVYTA